jgi:hypothetical protein
MIVRGQFKSLSEINTAPIMIVLRIDIPTQMGPSFISENVSFWIRTPLCTACKNQLQKSFLLIIAFFSYRNLCLFYMAVDVSILYSVFLI